MPAFPVTIPAPVNILTPGGPDNSYDYFISSLNSVGYKINEIYIQTTNVPQQTTPVQIYKYTPQGEVAIGWLNPLPSLYVLPSIGVVNLNTKKRGIVIDSTTFLNYIMQPFASVVLIFDYSYLDINDLLPNRI